MFKKSLIVLPPPRKILTISISAGIVAALMPLSALAESAETETEVPKLYDSFYGYEWGTKLEDIQASEVEEGMLEGKDYYLEPDVIDGVDQFELYGIEVGGYETVALFLCEDGILTAGGYDVDDEFLPDLKEKYIDVYGAPAIEKESIGWGSCSVWIDEEKNYIIISELLGIEYVSCDSLVNEDNFPALEEYHGIDLESELNAVGNLDNI